MDFHGAPRTFLIVSMDVYEIAVEFRDFTCSSTEVP